MALAKDRTPQDYSNLGAVQACTFAGTAFGEPPVQFPVQEPGGGCSDVAGVFFKNLAVSPRGSSSISSTPSTTSSIRMYQCLNQQFEETDHSVISFSPGFNSFLNSGGSLLSFDQNDHIHEYPIWGTDSMNQSTNPRLLENSNSVQTSGGNGLITGSIRENPPGGEPFRWLNPEETTAAATIKELEKQEACANKRSHPGDTVQAMKKQCTDTRKTKMKATSTKDPQSIAAKNRRERISDRLKVLQDLVPNGSKVDLVTMLEKAISYVKFLQLQVKVLATDEFWPVQGGKAPDLAQVREAIDSILASQRDSNSRAQSNGE